MKKIIGISMLLAIVTSKCFSQEYSREPGRLTSHELTMEAYEHDLEAEAVVIYDLGKYRFHGNYNNGRFMLRMEKKVKIKILKTAGLKYAEIEIPYYTESVDLEEVESISATTYNLENGVVKKTELSPKNIHVEKLDQNWRIKKIAFSDVRVGSIIEYQYTIVTPFYFNMRRWNFQQKIPVVYSDLKYYVMPYYEYAYIMIGASKFDEYSKQVLNEELGFGQYTYKEVLYDFGMKNLPAFRDEEFITSERDYMVSLNFQLSNIHRPSGSSTAIMTTWPEMCNDLLKESNFGKYIKKSESEAKKILPALELENKTDEEKVRLITEYVKSKYSWNGIQSKYASDNVSSFLKKQTGNSADLNLFLIGMLNAAGIDASPVMLSTRGNGAISSDHPFLQFFNYVLPKVQVNNNTFFLDATESLLYFNELPERCINVSALVVKPKSDEIITIGQQGISRDQKFLTVVPIPETNTANVDVKCVSTGADAYGYRSIYLGKTENLTKYLKSKKNIEVKGKLEVENYDKLDKELSYSYKFDTPIESTGTKVFIQPFCGLSISNNPFKQTNRSFPVDIVYAHTEAYQAKILIPEGYKVEHLPESINDDNDYISITYNAHNEGNNIFVLASYTLKQSLYKAESYMILKTTLATIIEKVNEMVILVKE